MSGKDPVTFWRAHEVQEIAEGLIEQFHEHIAEGDVHVRYVFVSKHTMSKGRVRLAHMQKVGGLNAYLAQSHELEAMSGTRPPAPVAEPFFVMVVAYDTWTQLTGPQRIALIDHELKHIGQDGELVGHDIEEFSDVIARHGAWKPDLSAFIEASKQQPLFEGAQPRRKSATAAEEVH